MKIVIDIPEDRYKEILQNDYIPDGNFCKNMINAVKNGTPLPKGHGRLIDEDEILFENSEFDTYGDYSRAFDAIDQADAIIEADKAESENKGMYIACKKCKYNYDGECDFYDMGSGNEIDMPCYREKELIKEASDNFLQAFVGAESEE